MMDEKAILAQAQKELDEEKFRAAVDAAKEKIRRRKPWVNRLFPFKIVIVRR